MTSLISVIFAVGTSYFTRLKISSTVLSTLIFVVTAAYMLFFGHYTESFAMFLSAMCCLTMKDDSKVNVVLANAALLSVVLFQLEAKGAYYVWPLLLILGPISARRVSQIIIGLALAAIYYLRAQFGSEVSFNWTEAGAILLFVSLLDLVVSRRYLQLLPLLGLIWANAFEMTTLRHLLVFVVLVDLARSVLPLIGEKRLDHLKEHFDNVMGVTIFAVGLATGPYEMLLFMSFMLMQKQLYFRSIEGDKSVASVRTKLLSLVFFLPIGTLLGSLIAFESVTTIILTSAVSSMLFVFLWQIVNALSHKAAEIRLDAYQVLLVISNLAINIYFSYIFQKLMLFNILTALGVVIFLAVLLIWLEIDQKLTTIIDLNRYRLSIEAPREFHEMFPSQIRTKAVKNKGTFLGFVNILLVELHLYIEKRLAFTSLLVLAIVIAFSGQMS